MKKNHKGIFFLSLSGLVAALLLVGCPNLNKNGDSHAVAGSTRTGIAFSGKKLEITFDKELKSFDVSQITITLDNSVIPSTAYKLEVSGKKLVMTFTAPPRANQKYKVTLKARAVTSIDGGSNKATEPAQATFGTSPASQSIEFADTKLEITFDKTLDEPIDAPSAFHPDPSKVTITRAGKALINKTDYTLGIDGAKLVITFKTNPEANQKYTVTLGEGAVKSNARPSTAVSPAKEIVFGVTPPPVYTKGSITQNNDKIELSFSKALATMANVSPNPTHITVTRTSGEGASETLTIGTDYSLRIAGKKLVITLINLPIAGNYTVALRGKAVKSFDGKFSETVKSNPTITMYNLPAIVRAVFETGSSTKLVATFNTALFSIDTGKITVQSKAAAKDYANVSGATAALNNTDKTKVIITLPDPATEPKVYRVVVAIGGVTATAGGVSNIAKLESAGVAYSINPALADTPYIVGKKLVATFNMNIALVPGAAAKVQVWKGAELETQVTGTSTIVPSATKTLLEVTLADSVVATEIYRLKLLADAVSKEGDTDNKNLEFTSSNITILAAPDLDTTQDPYMVGRKIYVTFDKAIEAGAVDTAKVKVASKSNTQGARFGNPTKPTATSVINPTNNKQLVITVDDPIPDTGDFYRVHLETGAITNRNTVLTAAITPEDKDIQVTASPALTANTQPVFSSTTELSVSFKVAVAFVDIKAIKVQSSPDGTTFTDVITANRTIAIDGDNSKKVNITLTNGTEATPYTQTWKVIFPVGSVRDAKRNGNNTEQATAEIKPRLSDIYSWNEVLANAPLVSDNRWTARQSHTSVVFKDKIWVMGGFYGTNYLNDVWSSADGENWTNESNKLLTSHAEGSWIKYASLKAAVAGKALWATRYAHSSVVFQNKIWVLGGNHYPNRSNDVWSSADGITWAKSPAPTNPTTEPWSERQGHASTVFPDPNDGNKEKIWVMGGFDGTNYLNDVWSSADGSNWNKAEKTAQGNRWLGRDSPKAVVAGNKIWVLGGGAGADARGNSWYSTDGKDWTEATKLFSEYSFTTASVLFKSRIWALGGGVQDPVIDGGRINEVFSLAEGANENTAWETENNARWSARHEHDSVVFKDKIWVLGGRTGFDTYVNDVWSFGVQN